MIDGRRSEVMLLLLDLSAIAKREQMWVISWLRKGNLATFGKEVEIKTLTPARLINYWDHSVITGSKVLFKLLYRLYLYTLALGTSLYYDFYHWTTFVIRLLECRRKMFQLLIHCINWTKYVLKFTPTIWVILTPLRACRHNIITCTFPKLDLLNES